MSGKRADEYQLVSDLLLACYRLGSGYEFGPRTHLMAPRLANRKPRRVRELPRRDSLSVLPSLS